MRKIIIALGLISLIGAASASDLTKTNLEGTNKVLVLKKLVVPEDRTVFLKEEIDQYSINTASDQIKELNKVNNSDIYLIINSPGGEVGSGFEFVTLLQSMKTINNQKVICVIETKAYSMAAIISQFCHKTYIQKYASIMHHQAAYQVQGSQEQVKNRVEFSDRILNVYMTEIAAQMGLSTEVYKDKIRQEWWFTAEDATKYGIVDGIVNNLLYTKKAPEQTRSLFPF